METRVTKHVGHAAVADVWELGSRYSSLTKLLRVTAYCMRFGFNLLQPAQQRRLGCLSPAELRDARNVWIRIVQNIAFGCEIYALRNEQVIPPKSSLHRMNPFLDDSGLLRIGGQLQHSILAYDEKHPILLPKDSSLTMLIVAHAHTSTLHGGTQLTLSYLRRTYWILGGRTLVRSHIHRCRACLPYRAVSNVPIMGDLPRNRVTPSRPFLNSGVDYAGPIQLRTNRGRGHRSYKGYISVFICLATRAIHLEAVSDYTTQAFLAAFKRFTARRGICATLLSDQGTTFIGAERELRHLMQESSPQQREIAEILANDGTEWRFIPPASPHFGGIWEAGVRSVKHHLRRVIGDHTLTYEELATLLSQVEACLNSRPLQALNDDPTDLVALTPGHFLIGSAPTIIPEPELHDTRTNRLTRWQLLRQMCEHFWQRWAREYLVTLQARTKWTTTRRPVQVRDVCLLMDKRLPPTKWALARVTATHPGPDNQVRVVTIRTSTTTLTRPVAKLCLLVPADAAPGLSTQS